MSTSLQAKAANIEANGHTVIPYQSNGNPKPYGDKQRYPSYMVRADDMRCPDKIGQSRIKQPEQFSNTSC